MSVNDSIPDMGACSGIPDMGAWQFVIPDGMRNSTLRSEPAVTGAFTSTSAGTAKFLGRTVIEGKFSANQS